MKIFTSSINDALLLSRSDRKLAVSVTKDTGVSLQLNTFPWFVWLSFLTKLLNQLHSIRRGNIIFLVAWRIGQVGPLLKRVYSVV